MSRKSGNAERWIWWWVLFIKSQCYGNHDHFEMQLLSGYAQKIAQHGRTCGILVRRSCNTYWLGLPLLQPPSKHSRSAKAFKSRNQQRKNVLSESEDCVNSLASKQTSHFDCMSSFHAKHEKMPDPYIGSALNDQSSKVKLWLHVEFSP